MNQSRLFQDLTSKEIGIIAFHHFGKRSFSFHLLKGGMFNTTYQIDFSMGKSYVLRVGPVNRHLLLPFEEHLMLAEEQVYRLCREKGIPVPTVTACVTDKAIIDRDYMITEHIFSRCLNSPEISQQEKRKLYEDVGRITFQLHGINGEKFGRVFDVLSGGGYDCWGDFLQSEFSQTVEKLRQHSIFQHSELNMMEKIPGMYRDVLNQIQEAHLIHTDLWEGNVLVTPDSQKVAALIDADRALFGDTAYEFASGWMINEAFLSGYGGIDSPTSDSILRQKIYTLLYRLIDTYVYLVEYDNIEGGMEAKEKVLELTRDLLSKA